MIIFEPQCVGFAHAKVNAAYILLYSKAFPTDRITLFGEARHIGLIQDQLACHDLNIRYESVNIPNANHSYLFRIFLEFLNVSSVLALSRQRKSNIIFLSITSATLFAIKILGLGPKKNIFVIIHGILERTIEKPSGIFGRVVWFKYYLIYFNLRAVRYILLGRFIENNLLTLFPKLGGYTCSLELPYDFTMPLGEDLRKSRNIVFASAGVATIDKGSHNFFKLASDVFRDESISNVEFWYIGHFGDKRMNHYINECVILPSKDAPLQESAYQAYFMNADYLVFFYPQDSYRLTFSAVFLDAVKYEKPIIAIRNAFFTYYFKRYGDLGWLCSDYQEVLTTVIELSGRFDVEKLETISKNYAKIKSELSVSNQARVLKALIT